MLFRSPKPKKEVKLNEHRVGRKIHNTIPIRIYFADGRVIDYPDGASHFAKNNPGYSGIHMSKVRLGKRKNHKDIMRIETL